MSSCFGADSEENPNTMVDGVFGVAPEPSKSMYGALSTEYTPVTATQIANIYQQINVLKRKLNTLVSEVINTPQLPIVEKTIVSSIPKFQLNGVNTTSPKGVVYTATASSVAENCQPYLAFQGSNGNVFWHCAYSGSTGNTYNRNPYNAAGDYVGGHTTNPGYYYSTNGVGGEWIQCKVSVPAVVTSYGIMNRGASLDSRNPVQYYLFGSNDGETFTQLDVQNTPTTSVVPAAYTIQLSNTTPYTYFRLVVGKIGAGGSVVNLSRFDLGFLEITNPYALALNGNQYAQVADSASYVYEGGEGGHLEAWIKTTLNEPDKLYGIIVKDGAFGMYLRNGKLTARNFEAETSPNNPVLYSGTTTINDGQWHHIAYNFGDLDNTLFVDGAEDLINFYTGPMNQTGFLRIGFGVNFFTGFIDGIKIWNYPRDTTQIIASYNKTEFSTTGCVGYWPCDEGTGSTLKSAIGGAPDMTLYGGPTWSRDVPFP